MWWEGKIVRVWVCVCLRKMEGKQKKISRKKMIMNGGKRNKQTRKEKESKREYLEEREE